MTDREKIIGEALEIIAAIQIPTDDLTTTRKRRTAIALLAVANMKPGNHWSEASCMADSKIWAPTTREIIKFSNENYGTDISSGSYDDIRRKDLVRLVEAGIIVPRAGKPGASTNNPTRGYAISREGIEVLRNYGQPQWKESVARFIGEKGSLRAQFEKERELTKIPVNMPGNVTLKLDTSLHNEIQKAVIEEFLPRFAPTASILYIGDAQKKILHIDRDRLRELGFFEIAHEKLPDIVAYLENKNWIFLIEAVHSSNPMSKERHLVLERLTESCTAGKIYVSAFKGRASFRKWVNDVSWETEVWLADSPNHMIHFDGEKFLGPFKKGN